MKHLFLFSLLLSTLTAPTTFAGDDGETPAAWGIFVYDVTLNQNLQDINDRILEKLKLTALEGFFDINDNWKAKASFFSYQGDVYRVARDREYFVKQIQLVSAEITSIVPLKEGFVMTITAHFGVGVTPTKWVDGKELMLTAAELEKLKSARDCPNCIREGVEQGGQLPVETGARIQIDYKKSYFKIFGDFQRSGNYRRLLDESGSQYPNYGYRMVFDWERRNVTEYGAEFGRNFNWGNGRFTAFVRAQKTKFVSTAKIAEQGDIPGGSASGFGNQETIRRTPLTYSTVELGIRLKISTPVNLKRKRR